MPAAWRSAVNGLFCLGFHQPGRPHRCGRCCWRVDILNLIPPYVWTSSPWDSYPWLAWRLLASALFRALVEKSDVKDLPLAGIFLAAEWHLVWAAASGMETILFALWIMGVFYLLSDKPAALDLDWFSGGASAWVRPDGITLLGPALFVWRLLSPGQGWRRWKGFAHDGGFCIGFAPYLLFNRLISGVGFQIHFMPSRLSMRSTSKYRCSSACYRWLFCH
jgi:hypothetical protein